MQAGGRRRKITLKTNDKDEAARRAGKLYDDIRARGWEPALAAFDPTKAGKTDCVTVGDFIEAAGTGLAPRSLRGYVGSFRWIVAAVFGIEGGEPRPDAPNAYYRAAKTFKRLTAWLRGKGVMGGKPLHTLRKEFGSMIAATADIHTASRQLRHSNISTALELFNEHQAGRITLAHE